jgi:hypothetical protein
MGQIFTLYQTGVVSDLLAPPIPIFDSSKVDASNYAYSCFNSPDRPLMILNYAITAWLASAGGKNRAQNSPWLPIAIAGKMMDSLLSAELAREEWSENEALCAYCQVATLGPLPPSSRYPKHWQQLGIGLESAIQSKIRKRSVRDEISSDPFFIPRL